MHGSQVVYENRQSHRERCLEMQKLHDQGQFLCRLKTSLPSSHIRVGMRPPKLIDHCSLVVDRLVRPVDFPFDLERVRCLDAGVDERRVGLGVTAGGGGGGGAGN